MIVYLILLRLFMNKMDLENIIIKNLRGYNPELIGIFGSFARNESTVNSDLGLYVRFSKALSLLKLIRLENEISEKLGIKVDLITEGSVKNKRIKSNIFRDMKVIYHA
jgi:uncharacterized protein